MTTQHFGKFRAKIKIMSTHNFWSEICSHVLEFCRIFAMLVGKLQLHAPLISFTHNATGCPHGGSGTEPTLVHS